MSWDQPLVLGMTPLVAVAVWWMFRRSGMAHNLSLSRIRRLWADLSGLHEARAAHRRGGRGLLLAAGALLAVAALARPQWGTIEETTYDQSREVLLALDLSRSMLADDVSPTRLDRAKLLVESLLDQLRGERVGLVVFAGTSFLQSPLSAEYDVLRDFMRDLDPSYLPQGGTNYGAMMQTALKAFSDGGNADRFLVVLSDGEAHDEDWKALVPSLKQKNIRVLGLGVGTPAGGLVPDGNGGVEKDDAGAAVLSRLEPATLRQLSAQTGGAYRDAAAWVDISELVDTTVAKARAGRFAEKKETRLRDQYQWFLAPALMLLLLSFWLDFPVLPMPRTLPRRQVSFAPVRAATSAIALLLALAAVRAEAAVDPAQPNELEQTVAALAAKPDLGAGDYSTLATTTIGYASQADAAAAAAKLAVIDDALRAVDTGEQLDARAANWPDLREQLEALKKQEEEKQQQAQNEEQKQEEEKQQQQQAGGGNSDQEQQQQPGTSDGAANDSERGNSQDEGENPDARGDQQQPGNEQEPKPLDDPNTKIGAMQPPKTENDADQEIGAPGGTRMVGGGAVQPQQQQNPDDPQDVAMLEALDRMQRVQEGDSPATLFERMNRAEGAPPPAKVGKNW